MRTILILGILCASGCASVATPQLRPLPPDQGPSAAVDCGDLTSQSAMNDCFILQARKTEGILEALLKELDSALDRAEVRALGDAQERWLAYRRAHCDWDAPVVGGGSIQPMWWANCMASLTWNRIETLKFHLCEGRGMTGECAASKRYDLPRR